VNEAFLTELEKIGDRLVYQFSIGAEPLPFETGSFLPQRTLGQLSEIIARHPKLRFQCFLASRHANQTLCTMARELPNLSLAGYWWHNFFPGTIRQVMGERFDMVPANKQIGFFSDAYCAEWTYGKAVLVRKLMAQVLAERIEQGQFSMDDALNFSRTILYENPQTLIGMKPRKTEAELSGKKAAK
jgi:glucuronate isomerase